MKNQKNYDNKNYGIWISDGNYRKVYEKRQKRYKSHSDRDYDINWRFVFLVLCFALIITYADFVCSRIWSCM